MVEPWFPAVVTRTPDVTAPVDAVVDWLPEFATPVVTLTPVVIETPVVTFSLPFHDGHDIPELLK